MDLELLLAILRVGTAGALGLCVLFSAVSAVLSRELHRIRHEPMPSMYDSFETTFAWAVAFYSYVCYLGAKS